jgi:hypothetical protein
VDGLLNDGIFTGMVAIKNLTLWYFQSAEAMPAQYAFPTAHSDDAISPTFH